jgi:hypothetical protein
MRAAILTLVFLMLACPLARGQAPTLRYDWQPQQSFAYKMTVVVDLPDKTETYQGVTTYKVQKADGDSRLVVYQGGLGKSTKSKVQARGFGPRRIGPPPSPFSRNNFRGSDQTTSEITLTPLGQVTSLKGDSHLPYLLGNVSLLPFEPLPETAKKEWTAKSGTSITEQAERTERFRRFGPFGPFGDGAKEEEVQAATETTTYSITGQDGDLVSVAKTYELKSPAPKEGEKGLTLGGSGTWKFNARLNVPESLDMDLKLVVSVTSAEVTVPITIDYARLTPDELAKVEAERERQAAELRKRHEDLQAAKAEEKRRSEMPLTADEKQAALAALAGADAAAQVKALADLATKNPLDADPDVASAIEALLKHDDQALRLAAHQALLKWSMAYRPRGELDEDYAGPRAVASSARPVSAQTPLYVGQIVQLRDNRRWIPADILELAADGRVKVHPRGRNTDAWDKLVSRDQLQLAPDELFQPARSPAASGGLHTWTDVSGTHKIQAEYLGVQDGKVRLKRQDGREISVPLASLSKADQDRIEQLQKAVAAPRNPFE